MMLSDEFLRKTAKFISSTRSRDFFLRMYQKPEEIYIKRIRNINFVDKSCVLDAGCGFGQWSIALASLNKLVYAIETDMTRLEVARKVANQIGVKNIKFMRVDIENIPMQGASVDAIFCYSTIYYTDLKKTLNEFYRVLKPNGKLYFNTNGLGWYIYNIIERPYSAIDFDPQQIASEAVKIFLDDFEGKCAGSERQPVITSRHIIRKILSETGFDEVIVEGEGKIVAIADRDLSLSFFEENYYGQEGVFEVLCKK
ncbi:MAG: class I SAM-dependent methyltransferase [Omnitrophica bacterium]|nr:class I SAM-dependent methyltransferase [Candidatus Omnitrophota bacterium]